MAVRIIVGGGREFTPTDPQRTHVLTLLLEHQATEIVSGGARGADAMGEELAAILSLPVRRFLPDWDTLGKSAGPLRNRQMAEYADLAILLPGGRGTDSMREEMHRAGKPVVNVGDV